MNRSEILLEFNDKVESYFKGLTFEASKHEYFVNSKKIKKSVSVLLKDFVPFVDFAAKAIAIDAREGLSPGTTQALWDAKKDLACRDGSDTHNFAEGERKKSEADTAKKRAVMLFWSDMNRACPGRYVVVLKEQPMYHKKYLFSGTGDFILYDTWNDKFVIGDYKTNEDLFKNFRGQKMLSPFQALLDNPYNHYQLQLSFYQILLEQVSDYKVSERWIIWLLPDGSYQRYLTQDYTPWLNNWLEEKYLLKTAC